MHGVVVMQAYMGLFYDEALPRKYSMLRIISQKCWAVILVPHVVDRQTELDRNTRLVLRVRLLLRVGLRGADLYWRDACV